MALLTLKAKKCIMDESLTTLGIPPKGEEDFGWVNVCIRSEDIMEFYYRSDTKTVISFYDERPSLVVKENFENVFRLLNEADYNATYQDSED